MLNLELETYLPQLRLRKNAGKVEIFSVLRKKWLQFTPEESVRQSLVMHFRNFGYPASRMGEEKQIKVFSYQRRYDLVVFDQQAQPWLLVECKAPGVTLNQDVLDQIARYNLTLQVPFLLVTNGVSSHCFEIDRQKENYRETDALPRLP